MWRMSLRKGSAVVADQAGRYKASKISVTVGTPALSGGCLFGRSRAYASAASMGTAIRKVSGQLMIR